ncbi:hypothetical protein N7534_008309 [Penicillium rubens]|nr:hypothetical protein N7524_003666 [Penicillium chrysogenum]KAJ5277750.1 hypothetical protein N7524_003903 [Penicillium chrysogenum]KAJ5848976.1 hypothetical protein N7534_008294 [Penicillium rubens]KAJ5848991.1 hypothetical protein N7534_008309 [Penicillium rubens]
MRLDGHVDLTPAQKNGGSHNIANFDTGIVGQLIFDTNSLQGEVKGMRNRLGSMDLVTTFIEH